MQSSPRSLQVGKCTAYFLSSKQGRILCAIDADRGASGIGDMQSGLDIELAIDDSSAVREPASLSGLVERPGTVTWSPSAGGADHAEQASSVYHLTALLPAEDASAIAAAASILPFTAHDQDTVDSMPTHEHLVWHHAKPSKHSSPKMVALTKAATAARIEPYVRWRYDCPQCRACWSIVRRYVAGDRVRHPPHFDYDSFVTIVVALTAQRGSGSAADGDPPRDGSGAVAGVAGNYQVGPASTFRGGLYVRSEPGSERFVPAISPGDAVAHQYDVEHGVAVREGGRLSWIVWLQDGPCGSGAQARWHEADATRGNALAQYHLGQSLVRAAGQAAAAAAHRATGATGRSSGSLELLRSAASAREGYGWLRKSAEQGYGKAMLLLGNAHATGAPGAPKDWAVAWRWYERAAAKNYTDALHQGALMLLRRRQRGDHAAAAALLERAVVSRFDNIVAPCLRLASLYDLADISARSAGGDCELERQLNESLGTTRRSRAVRVLELYRIAALFGSFDAQLKLAAHLTTQAAGQLHTATLTSAPPMSPEEQAETQVEARHWLQLIERREREETAGLAREAVEAEEAAEAEQSRQAEVRAGESMVLAVCSAVGLLLLRRAMRRSMARQARAGRKARGAADQAATVPAVPVPAMRRRAKI